MSFTQELGPALEPYERLLGDAMAGDDHLFTREDAVEETWRVVQPLLDHPPPVVTYPQGSWGPEQASRLVHGYAEWHQPWLPDGSAATRAARAARAVARASRQRLRQGRTRCQPLRPGSSAWWGWAGWGPTWCAG